MSFISDSAGLPSSFPKLFTKYNHISLVAMKQIALSIGFLKSGVHFCFVCLQVPFYLILPRGTEVFPNLLKQVEVIPGL